MAYRTQDLGEPLAVHRFTLGKQLRVIGAVFVLAPVLLTLLAVTGALPWGDAWTPMTYVGAIAMYVGMPGMGIALWVSARRRDGDVVRIHDRGLVHVLRGKERFVAWGDVESLTCDVAQRVTNGVPGPVTHRYVLVAPGGVETFTHGFERIEELAAALRRKTAEVIEPRVQEALLEKKTVRFGKLALTLKGVTYGGDTIPWGDAAARHEAGDLVLERKGGFVVCRVPIAEVPNEHVLTALVERMRARARA